MKELFVNRAAELEAFRSEILSTKGSTKLVILEGPSGIGKSAFTRRLLEDQGQIPAIKVEILAGVHPEGFFLHQVARAVNCCAAAYGIQDFRQFLGMVSSDEMRERYDRLVASSATEKVYKNQILPLNIEFDRLSLSGNTEATLMLMDYLQHTFSQLRIVLNIENIQNADATSLHLLRDIFCVPGGHFIILEFTIGRSGTRSIEEVELFFSQSPAIVVQRARLRKLPFADLLKLISNGSLVSLLERSYINHNGNLRELKDLDLFVSEQGYKELPRNFDLVHSGATGTRLESLNKPAVFTLSCIVAHKSKVSIDLLRMLSGNRTYLPSFFVDFAAAVSDLQSLEIVKIEDNHVSVVHDSISDAITGGEAFQRFLVIAFQAWAYLYGRIYSQSDFSFVAKSEVLYLLFHFYLRTDALRLLGVLDDIKHLAMNSLYPGATLSLLQRLRESVAESAVNSQAISERVTFALVDIYYGLGLFEEAMRTLAGISQLSPRRNLLHAALLDRLDRHEEAIQFVSGRLTSGDASENPPYELCLKMVLMTSYRSINRYRECARVFRGVLADEARYAHLPEYGYLLRNAKLVLSYRESIDFLKRSVEHFRSHGLAVAEAHSRISLSMPLAELGSIDVARRELVLAESLLEGNTMERHVILNDKAVLRLYDASPDFGAAVDLFHHAMVTVTTSFDKLAILNNLLIASCLSADLSLGEDLQSQLISLLGEQPDKIMHRLTYFNLAFYAQVTGNASLREHFLSMAKQSDRSESSLWAHRLHGDPLEDEEYEFLARFPYDTAYLTFWHFEIPDCNCS